jgi:hypothetical protein
VARIYRKYIDMHASGGFRVDPRDIEDLKLAFNRDFTTGFAFNDSVVDPAASTNRGIFLGKFRAGTVRLESDLKVGDGVMVLDGDSRSGNTVTEILMAGQYVAAAGKGDTVAIKVRGAAENSSVYKNFSGELKVYLGNHFEPQASPVAAGKVSLPEFKKESVPGEPMLFVKAQTPSQAREADKAGADTIYYDVFADDLAEAGERVRSARFFPAAPRVMSDLDIDAAVDIVGEMKPDGVLVGERGLLSALKGKVSELHLDHSLNVFNDIDIASCGGIPVISPELSFDELAALRSKRFIAHVHGPLVLMTTREPIAAKVLVDGKGRRFGTRRAHGMTEVLNCSELGLFNLARKYLDIGIRWFYLEPGRDPGKLVKVYRRILSGENFDDRKMRKGYTTGHFRRGVE